MTKQEYLQHLNKLDTSLQEAKAKGEHDKAAMLKNDLTVWKRKVGYPFWQRNEHGSWVHHDPEAKEMNYG